nr:ultraviolet sensitive opsin 2 [Ptosima undecimmaculata]
MLPINWTAHVLPQPRVMDPGPLLVEWNIRPEDLIYIPEHWLKYPPPEASLHFLLGLLYVGFFVMSTIGNGLVLWIFSTAKSLRTPSNMFVVNLAFCDFVMMLKTPIFIFNSFSRGFASGILWCEVFAIAGSFTGIGAGMTNACIAYDRYHTITNPLEGKLTTTKAFVMLIFVWLYTVPWSILPFLKIWGGFIPEGFLTQCGVDYLTRTFDNRLFVTTLFTFSYVIPMSLIIFYYSQIVTHVFHHEKALREQAKKMNVDSLRSNQQQQNQSAEIRIAKVAITICFLFVASWTPYAVLCLIGIYGDQSLLTPGFAMIPALTCKSVACLDPYVYALSHPRYRLELQKRLPWLAISEKAPSDTQSVGTESVNTNKT